MLKEATGPQMLNVNRAEMAEHFICHGEIFQLEGGIKFLQTGHTEVKVNIGYPIYPISCPWIHVRPNSFKFEKQTTGWGYVLRINSSGAPMANTDGQESLSYQGRVWESFSRFYWSNWPGLRTRT